MNYESIPVSHLIAAPDTAGEQPDRESEIQFWQESQLMWDMLDRSRASHVNPMDLHPGDDGETDQRFRISPSVAREIARGWGSANPDTGYSFLLWEFAHGRAVPIAALCSAILADLDMVTADYFRSSGFPTSTSVGYPDVVELVALMHYAESGEALLDWSDQNDGWTLQRVNMDSTEASAATRAFRAHLWEREAVGPENYAQVLRNYAMSERGERSAILWEYVRELHADVTGERLRADAIELTYALISQRVSNRGFRELDGPDLDAPGSYVVEAYADGDTARYCVTANSRVDAIARVVKLYGPGIFSGSVSVEREA